MRGALTTPAEMERTYIASVDRHSLFDRRLRAAMKAAGVQIVEDASSATATFTISIDETDQRVLSVSTRNVPTEFEVFYTVEYGLDDGAKSLLEVQLRTLTRNYTYDSTLVLGKAKEEELLREAIVDDLVRIVLKQISTL